MKATGGAGPSVKGWLRNLSGPKKVVAGVLAVAATIGTLWGGISAVVEASQRISTWVDDRTKSELLVTPRLGLQLWQNDVQNEMFFRDESSDVIRVAMKADPFELRFPREQDRELGIRICAWVDESIFIIDAGMKREQVPFFTPGTGVADYDYGSGRLLLADKAHNYFVGTRIAQQSETQDKIYVATVARSEAATTPLTRQKEDLFLVAYVDKNKDNVIDLGEFEYVVLDF